MSLALLDTDTLSEVMKGRDPKAQQRAREYLSVYGQFTFSIITRCEILRGLKAKEAARQILAFEDQCRKSAGLARRSNSKVVPRYGLYAAYFRERFDV